MYVIKRYNHPIGRPNSIYQQWLNENRQFVVATNSAKKFATPALAVAYWHSVMNQFSPTCETWIEGPRGGRYCSITGKRI